MKASRYILSLIITIISITDSKSQATSDSTILEGYFEEFYNRIPNYDSCILVLKKAEVLSSQLDDSLSLSRSLDLIGWNYQNLKNYDLAELYYKKALIIAESTKDSLRIGNIYNHLSGLNESLGFLDDALNYSYKSFSIYHSLNYYKKYTQSFNNIGNIYFQLKNYEKANEYFKKAIEEGTVNQNKSISIKVLGNYLASSMHSNNNHIVDSLDRKIDSLIHHKVFKEEDFYSAKFNYGIFLARNNKRDEAIKLFKNLLSFKTTQDNPKKLSLIYLYFAKWYMEMDIDSSKYYLDYGSKIAKDFQIIESQLLSHKLSSEFYETTKDFERANISLNSYLNLYDSLYNVNVYNEINDIQLGIERNTATKELSKKDRVIESKTKLNYLLISIVLISAILIIVIAILAYRNFVKNTIIEKKNKQLKISKAKEIERIKKEHELNALQIILESQETERRRIASDLHDRLGAKLSTLRLCLSNPSIPDNNMKLLDEIIYESRGISHEIYSGTLEKYGFSNAIEDLLDTIQNTGKVTIDYSYEKVYLEKEHEKPLYCIIQELINNTLKHANATRIHLTIKSNSSGDIILTYSDNGKGYSYGSKKSGLGFKSIEARIAVLKAKLEVNDKTINPIIQIRIPCSVSSSVKYNNIYD